MGVGGAGRIDAGCRLALRKRGLSATGVDVLLKMCFDSGFLMLKMVLLTIKVAFLTLKVVFLILKSPFLSLKFAFFDPKFTFLPHFTYGPVLLQLRQSLTHLF